MKLPGSCRLGRMPALLLSATLFPAAALAADGYAIRSLNAAPTPEFVRSGNAVQIRVSAPSAALVLRSVVKLNGQNVTSLFVPDSSTPGSLVATVPGLRTGVNTFELFSGKTSNVPLARYVVSTSRTPQLACNSLVGFQIPGDLLPAPTDVVTITSAVFTAATGALPEHCIVRGNANPRIGYNNVAFSIGFEVRLPAQWSGRFSFQGGGGNDGSVGAALGNSTGGLGTLARGFAVVTTDGGHTGGAASSFGFDEQARIDHGYNAYDKSALIAKALMTVYYGKQPDRSYFQGCSGGGRQGMMFTQRFPGHFDGVIAGAPAMSVSKGASISAAWESMAYLEAAPVNANGQRVLSQAFSNADLTLVSNSIIQACDALDGLADNTVNNHLACRQYDPVVLQCTGPKTPTCLTGEQVGALRKGFGGPKNSAGESLYFSWPWDPGISSGGWRSWKLGSSTSGTPNSSFATLIQDATRYEFLTPPDPTYSIFNFDFDTDPARLANVHYGAWQDDRLDAFKARGGKLMIYHGASDAIFSMTESIDYVDRVYGNHGAEQGASFVRHFAVPGMTHCSGGPATDRFDSFAAMMDWVENGVAPERMIATGASLPGRTRPLCPHPKYARYKGSGDVNDAANFVCQ